MFADILLPFALSQVYTYRIPDEFLNEIRPGIRVVVQFGARRMYSGLVYQVHSNQPQGHEVKEILSVLDSQPVVNQFQLDFWKWMADYYMCSMGEVMKAALPAGLKLESETRLIFNADFDQQDDLSEKEQYIYSLLEEKNSLTISEIAQSYTRKDILGILKGLIEKEAIFAEEHLREGYKPTLIYAIQFATAYKNDGALNQVLDNLKRAPKQAEIIQALVRLGGFDTPQTKEITRQELLKEANATGEALKALLKKGIVELTVREASAERKSLNGTYNLKQLTDGQQTAFSQLKEMFLKQDTLLLHGITSSGKTEVYFHLIAEELKKGNQVLYLLPEIALTAQMINRLSNTFGDCIGIYHSKYSDTQRTELWQELLKGAGQSNYKIILGVRSSIFLPFTKLGLVIVDEEHENSFKQFDPSPRYNARDAAIVLSRFHGAKTLLGTATPSLETYFNTKAGKYGLIELTGRFGDISLPKIELADTLRARKKKQMRSHFHPALLDQIQHTLDAREQIILFQNRRGFAPYMQCSDCATIPKCRHCDVSLTYHKGINQLICHYCGYSAGNIGHCKSCGSNAMKVMGFGTEKIEEELELFFPGVRIARMDLDSTRTRKSYENLLSDFDAGHIDILVGTQMVTKGLDFERVSLVGILDADHLLNYPDFRAYERSFQLMAQVSGRAGRKHKQGKVIIQTSTPLHPIIQMVVKNNYNEVYRSQLMERKQFLYPPYFRLIQIAVKHRTPEMVNKAAEFLAARLRNHFKEKVIGPEFMLIPRMQNLYQKQILIKIPRDAGLAQWKLTIREEMAAFQSTPEFKPVLLTVDVDPM